MNCKSVQIIILILILFSILFSKDNKNKSSNISLQKPQETSDIWLDVNRFHGVFRNNGIWYFDVIANTQGTEWPKGSGNSPIFAGGQWISAKINNEIKVAAVQYSATEFQPGEIISTGIASNPKDNKYRWYKINSDGTGDWNNWPTDQGAPLDENGNPLLIGDQTIFSVWNDLSEHYEFGTNPLNIEVRQTAFAIKNNYAVGDMQFIKWQLVNKSGEDWDSTYFSIWLDPDLGDASDDLVGCDTILGLGYCYNAQNEDQNYGLAPPAVGIDLLQGPIIDAPGFNVILPNGKILRDKKMQQTTCFISLRKGDWIYGNPQDASDVWNNIRGFWRDGSPITFGDHGNNPPSTVNPITTFMYSGNPETSEGWLDTNPSDRRFVISTGPFSMPVWIDENNDGIPDFGEPGVQEIIASIMVARGTNNLNSVTILKEVDLSAQIAWNQNFELAEPPKNPEIQVSELANQIIFAWDERSEYNDDGSLYDSEDFFVSRAIGDTIYVNNLPVIIDDSTYNFYGYKVYQYSDVSGTDPVLVASWDIGENKNAKPYTKQRYIIIDKNINPVVGEIDTELINGKTYYYGVVAEGYLEFGNPKIIASKAKIISVTPRVTPGISYSSQYGDTLEVIHTVTNTNIPTSDGQVIAWVLDPSKTTGLEYTVGFNVDTTWYLFNSTGDTIANKQTNQTGNDAYTIYNGLIIKVISGSIPNTINDIFTFTAPAAAQSTNSKLKNDLAKIKVVPNPYYGLHSGELSQLDRWVQFTYLPPHCTIRIFTMSGHLVRTLEKNDPSTPFYRWNLLNENDIPVASGIFIYHIEAPGIGEKIGKMVIFNSTYRPDTWRIMQSQP